MRIILIGLASAFTEGMTYQDNLLAEQLKFRGHEITVVADCHEYQGGFLVVTDEEDRLLHNGIRLVRKKYKNIIGHIISGKVRAVEGLYAILESEKPDIIFHHGLSSYELLTVAKYKANNPKVGYMLIAMQIIATQPIIYYRNIYYTRRFINVLYTKLYHALTEYFIYPMTFMSS